MSSSKSTNDETEPSAASREGWSHYLTFYSYDFTRYVSMDAEGELRPGAWRGISAKQCLCGDPPKQLYDPANDDPFIYDFHFVETSDDELEEDRKKHWNRGEGFPVPAIGTFTPDQKEALICVPPSTMNVLWDLAEATDGVIRSIKVSIERRRKFIGKPGNEQSKLARDWGWTDWAVLSFTLDEMTVGSFERRFEKEGNRRPKIGPSPPDPVVVELRRVQAQLKSLKGWSGIIVVAIGVFVALWIAHLWR